MMRDRSGKSGYGKTDYLPAIKKTKSGVAQNFPFSFFLHGVHYDGTKMAFFMSNQNDILVVRCDGGTHAKDYPS